MTPHQVTNSLANYQSANT